MMRVLFCPAHYIFDSHREGSEFGWAYDIADRLASACPGSVVVTGRSDLREPKEYPILELTPNSRGLNMSNLHAVRFNIRYTATTLRALRAASFDVIHHILPFAIGRTFNFAVALPRRYTPVVIGPVQPPLSVPDYDVDPRDIRRERTIRRRRLEDGAAASAAPLLDVLSRQTLRRANRIVAVDATARTLLLAHGATADQIVVIPPGVDCDRFNGVATQDQGEGPIRLLVVCHLVRRKNVALVLDAFAEARRQGVSARLSVVGTGPQLDMLRAAARGLGIDDKVEFAGFVPHERVHERYREADVFLNASMAEGFSTTCLEAMASGLPVVSTSVGGFNDAVQDGYNGYLVAQGDAHEMADRIIGLSRDRALLRVLSKRARATVLQRFDWKRAVIPRYLDVYRGIVEKGDARPAGGCERTD